MWYLQLDTLCLLAILVTGTAIFQKCTHYRQMKRLLWLLPVAELAILAVISIPLTGFYIVYILLGLLCGWALHRWRSGYLFVLFSLLALVPFFLGRWEAFAAALPFPYVTIGLSFQMLKVIDIYYHIYYTQDRIDPLIFVNYMLFLPVFTSGPIFRYREFSATVNAPVVLTATEFTADFKRIIRGMFKKVVVTVLGIYLMQTLLSYGAHWYLSLCALVCSYVIIYCDLSGYSDLAIGFGRIAGFAVPENFKTPWKSPSFTQFWRCWHASLSNWIREHIFILLNKRRLNRGVSALVGIVTMIIMSLWHGFNWLYLVAGIYNGVLLAIENLLQQTTVNKRKTKKPVYVARCLFVSAAFALNTLVFTLTPEQLLQVLRGFVHL